MQYRCANVLQILWFLPWLAIATSLVMLVLLWTTGELRAWGAVAAAVVFTAAGWCQFGARSALVSAAGLLLQTLLAVYLIVWWRLAAP